MRGTGALLDSRGKPTEAEAEPDYREALEGYRRLLGDDHPDTLSSPPICSSRAGPAPSAAAATGHTQHRKGFDKDGRLAAR